MLSRRMFVGKLAAGAAVACAASVARAETISAHRESNTPTDSPEGAGQLGPAAREAVVELPGVSEASTPAPWELVHPLAMGSAVAHGWHVAGLTGAVDGSCVLTLQNTRGREHRVHLCANDGRPQGLVYTRRFDLVVMNGGQGELPTDEGFAQAVAEVAHVLAANESRPPADLVVALLPHRERVERFTAAAQLR